MAKWDDILIGGFIGALLAAPKKEDVQELNQYRAERHEIEGRRQAFGTYTMPSALAQYPKILKVMQEVYGLYLLGYYRAASLFSIVTIEAILKEKYGALKFENLIEQARAESVINQSDYNYLTGLRLDRNKLLHELEDKNIDDAQIIIKLTLKLVKLILDGSSSGSVKLFATLFDDLKLFQHPPRQEQNL